MMDKEATLAHLRAAKVSHMRWVQRAKLLINGLDIQRQDIPVNSTECEFGRWFYNDAKALNGLTDSSCIAKIEHLHHDLHDKYLSIFNIYFGVQQQSFISRLFHKKKELSTHDVTRARHYYSKIEEISMMLINEITLLERNILYLLQEECK